MLKKLVTVLRSLLARRSIAAIAGEIEKKIAKLDAAEAAILSHVGFTDDVVRLARIALVELEEKAKAEAKQLMAQVDKSRNLKNKLAA